MCTADRTSRWLSSARFSYKLGYGSVVQFISSGAKKSSNRMSHIKKVQEQNLLHQKRPVALDYKLFLNTNRT